jgi:hypothetical protein
MTNMAWRIVFVPDFAVRVGLRGLCTSERLNPLVGLVAFHNCRTRRQTGCLLASSGILLLVWGPFDRSRHKSLRDSPCYLTREGAREMTQSMLRSSIIDGSESNVHAICAAEY